MMSAAPVSTPHVPHDVWFWLWWVAATTLGWAAGFWLGFFLGSIALGGVMITLCGGLAVGLLQWQVLQAEVPRSGWWAPAGVAGLLLPIGLASLVWGDLSSDAWKLAMVAGGALAGVLQGRILRGTLARAWWWVAASFAGWGACMLGLFAIDYAGRFVDPETSPLVPLFYPFLLPTVVPALLLGAVTGGGLVWLLREPGRPVAPATAQPATRPRPIRRRMLIAAAILVGLIFLLPLLPRLWLTLTTPAEYRQYMPGVQGGLGIAFSADGALLATTSFEHGGALFEVATGQERLALPSAGRMTDVVFSPDGRLLATADGDAVRLRDAAGGAEIRVFPGPGAWRIAFSPDGTLLAAVLNDGTVRLLEVASGTTVHTFTTAMPFDGEVVFSPDGTLLAATVVDGTVRLLEVATGVERRSLEWEEGGGYYQAVAFSPDGSLLATGSANGKVRLWEVATGAELLSMPGHQDWVTRATFSPDGRVLATASDDKTVRLWEVATGTPLHTLAGHGWWVRGLAFSPDGATLATASFDGTVKLWDAATGEELRSIAWPGTP